jgi:large subunit ribosomal protein L6
VAIPEGVSVNVTGSTVTARGPRGELSLELPGAVRATVSDGEVSIAATDETRQARSFHGLARSLTANMIEGVSKGFTKELEIQGVGFRAAVQADKLILTLGFASPVEFAIPEGIQVSEEGGTRIVVSGPDKQLVGDVAARIRSSYPAEPYKGKGLRYRAEYVRRKVGKTVA